MVRRRSADSRTVDLTFEHTARAREAQAELEKAGLRLPSRPNDDRPVLPADPTRLDDRDLMELFSGLTAWADFLEGQLAITAVDERSAEDLADRATDHFVLRHMPDAETLRRREDTMTRVKAQVGQEPEVRERRQVHGTAYAKRKLVEAMFNSAVRDAAFVSRELTRRGIMEPAQRRNRYGNA